VCARLFEHCLPYQHDHDHWLDLSAQNIQISVPAQMRYYRANKTQLDNLVKTAKHQTIAGLSRRRSEPPDGVTIQEEPYEVVWKDGNSLFSEHCVDVGEPPDEYTRKNIPLFEKLAANGVWLIVTARSNGRLFGYLSSLLTHVLDSTTLIQATQLSLFVSADARGMNLPLRLERAALDAYQARGVGRVVFRAGARGSGPKMGAIYRRLGAEEDGRTYRLDLPGRLQ
jgi:GNAT superfamily N-acetyltransferase